MTKRCVACGEAFEVPCPSYNRVRCWTCRPGWKRGTRESVECAQCGKAFAILPGQARDLRKRGIGFYCGDPCKGKVRARLNGGEGFRCVTAEGYIRVYVPPEKRLPGMKWPVNGVMEHRYVMAEMLGRWPDSHETVHHINGDKTDNRPENLQLRSGGHGKGGVLRCRACGSHDIEHVGLI